MTPEIEIQDPSPTVCTAAFPKTRMLTPQCQYVVHPDAREVDAPEFRLVCPHCGQSFAGVGG